MYTPNDIKRATNLKISKANENLFLEPKKDASEYKQTFVYLTKTRCISSSVVKKVFIYQSINTGSAFRKENIFMFGKIVGYFISGLNFFRDLKFYIELCSKYFNSFDLIVCGVIVIVFITVLILRERFIDKFRGKH